MNNKFYFIIPWLVSCIISLAALLLNFSYELPRFEKVLDAVITFGSIIIGFLAALLGILITIKNSEIMKEIYNNNQDILLKAYFVEAISSGFIVIILSTIMHLLIGHKHIFVDVVFFIWMVCLSLFLFSSYRIISLLMKVLFKSSFGEDQEENAADFQNKIPVKNKEDKAKSASQPVVEFEKGGK